MSAIVARIVGLGLVLGLLGCSTGGGRLEPAPPPAGWVEEISRLRAEKDRVYRRSPESPILAQDLPSFRGLDYWPPDPAYRFVGPIEVNDRLERFTIPTTGGKLRPCERYGRVRFELQGRSLTLQVYRLLDGETRPGEESFFLPFADGTTGSETYPAGRFVDLEGPKGGPYLLDFNRAYNPLCAYGAPERFACPVTPPENRLPVRVEAGERGFKREPAKAS
jgi:hypothetical protein